MLTTPIKLKFVVLAQNWLESTHRMPILHCRCWWLIDVGLHGGDAREFSGEAPVVDQGSLRNGWLQTGLGVSGYALLCTDVRPSVGIHSATWLSRITGHTKLFLLPVLPGANDRSSKARCCQMRATVTF